MKKISITLLAFAAAVLAVSCQKEGPKEQKKFTPMTINAVAEGIGSVTKVEMAYKYDLLWQEDDRILVTDGTSSDSFTLTGGAGTTTGTFIQNGSVYLTGEVQAYYPQSLVEGRQLIWPAYQTVSQTVPMYSSKTLSSTQDQTFSFSSLGSVLQIVFNSTQPDIVLESIEIRDGEKPMSGVFHVDENGKAVIDDTDNAGITLNLGAGKALGKGANYFNIAVPANHYTALTIIFTTTDGLSCKFTGGSLDIPHNIVGRLTLTGEKFELHPIDLGLSVLWAARNVGASKPWEGGDFFSWGETQTKKDYQDYNYAYKDTPSVLPSDHDVATVSWGDPWRMPTDAEISELISGCEYEWSGNYNQKGVPGMILKSKINGNSMFLPVTGYMNGSIRYLGGTTGYYYSSQLDGDNRACLLYFDKQNLKISLVKSFLADRWMGMQIRPVCPNDFQNVTSEGVIVNRHSSINEGDWEVL